MTDEMTDGKGNTGHRNTGDWNTGTTSLAAQDGLVEALEKVRKCALVVPSIFPDRPPSVSWIVSELTKILPEMDAALTAIKEQHHD